MALKDEAAVVPQLIRRLSRINYPALKLTGLLVVEPDDRTTLEAIRATRKPKWLKPLIAPPGKPTTKPRALNIALAQTEGGLLTVYDAEDEPHPDQLQEAARRFAAAPDDLACLQAPLRIRAVRRSESWLERQFALEYAALFEVLLPFLARLGLPLPLGGTSNHFRVDVLKSVGGWDPWNLTEDADLGLRLSRLGYRTGVLTLPTRESPPQDVKAWIPQRTRWLKGYMQTIRVHLRDPLTLGWRAFLTLFLTLAAAVASAAVQGWIWGLLIVTLMLAAFNQTAPLTAWPDMALLIMGWIIAATCVGVGAYRAERTIRPTDLLTLPAYWSLATIAQCHAVWRLISEPYYWDKTPHLPDFEPVALARRPLRNRARLSTYAASRKPTHDPWKSRISTSTKTPTSAPE